MYRAGIIGCGRIGVEFEDCHLNAYIKNPKTDLIWICDKDLDTTYKTNWWIPYHSRDYKNMPALDIVSVCTPPETHCKICCDIAPYVKGIYCEKPIATTLEDADKMIEVCHKHGVILQINHQRRWMTPKFRFSRGILNTGSHAFDLVRQLFRDDIKVVMEYIDTDEYIFEFNFAEPMKDEHLIPKGLEHLIYCIENKKQSISSGIEGREALRLCLELEKSLK